MGKRNKQVALQVAPPATEAKTELAGKLEARITAKKKELFDLVANFVTNYMTDEEEADYHQKSGAEQWELALDAIAFLEMSDIEEACYLVGYIDGVKASLGLAGNV